MIARIALDSDTGTHHALAHNKNYFISTSGNTYPATSHKNQIDAEQRTPLLQYINQGGHATWYPRYLCLTVHHPRMSNLVQVSKATNIISNWNVDHCTTAYPLQVEGMDCGQHTAQSQQPVSEDTEYICTSLCFRTTLIPNAAPPREWEGFSKTDSTQYCNSSRHQNQEEAQLLTTPPMHQIQPSDALKDCSRNTDMNIKAQTEDIQTKASTRMRQEETQKKKKTILQKCYTVLHIYEHCT